MKFFIGSLLLYLASGSVVENNRTNTGVYVNHTSSCNFNHNTLEVICVNSEQETLVQYNNVNRLAMCEFHFCLTFRNNPTDVLCSGYQWSHGKHFYDPLTTPLAANYSFDYPGYQSIKVEEWFLGYNIMVDTFVQNKVSIYDGSIIHLNCGETGYTSCVSFVDTNGTEHTSCGGLVDVNMRDPVGSFLLGINMLALISGFQYIPVRYLFTSLRESLVMNTLIIPCLSIVAAFVLVSITQSFLVKTAMYVIGAFVGTVVGYIFSEFALRLSVCMWGPGGSVGALEDLTESVRMLREKDDQPKFEISGDDSDEDVEIAGTGEGLDEISLADESDQTTIELTEVTVDEEEDKVEKTTRRKLFGRK